MAAKKRKSNLPATLGKENAFAERNAGNINKFFGSFGKFFSTPVRYDDFHKLPDVVLTDEGDSYKIKVDIPGMSSNDMKFKVEKNRIIVTAEEKKQKEVQGKGYFFSEKKAESYYRSIPLPSEVLPKTAKADYGVNKLEINVKKADKK